MRIYLNELSEEPKHLEYTNQDQWVLDAVEKTQEAPLQLKPKYLVSFDIRKSHEVVFLNGQLNLNVGLICSRCANSFDYLIQGKYEAMFSNNKSLTVSPTRLGIAHSEPTNGTGQDPEMELLDKEYIELANVLKEQIYLLIPVQPLCNTECKGICAVCGQDQNTQPCQCHRIKKTALATALKKAKFRISNNKS